MAIRITIEVTFWRHFFIFLPFLSPRFFQTLGTLALRALRSELDEFGCADQQFGLQLCAALLQHSTLEALYANGMKNWTFFGCRNLKKSWG